MLRYNKLHIRYVTYRSKNMKNRGIKKNTSYIFSFDI